MTHYIASLIILMQPLCTGRYGEFEHIMFLFHIEIHVHKLRRGCRVVGASQKFDMQTLQTESDKMIKRTLFPG